MSMDLRRWIEQFDLATHAPWWLHAEQCLWLVEEGAVDIVATGISDNQPVGPRRPLYRVLPEMAMMPVERGGMTGDQALLALPLPQTRVRSIPLAALKQLDPSGENYALVAPLVASWIGVITRGEPLAPKDYRALRGDEPLSLQKGQTFGAADRLLWAKLSAGTAAFMDDVDLQITSEMPALPLRSDVWCRALTDVHVGTVAESELFASGEYWLGVSEYQRLAIRHALHALDRQSSEEAARLHFKAEQAAKVMHEALSRFVGVVQGARDLPVELSNDPLLAACELIGRRIGVAFRAPPTRTHAAAGIDPLQEIADASAVRTRAVALKGEWWRDDNGPLLAFHAETRAPYALLPLMDRRYEIHDPTTGEVKSVTPQTAQTIGSFATQFYRPFSPTAIKPFDMLKFAVQGKRRDITAILTFGILGGMIGTMMPVAMGRMVDTVIPSAQHNDAIALMLALIAAIIASQIFEVVRSAAVLRVEGKMDGGVQAAVWDRVLALPVPFFRNYAAGDLANRINGINVIRHALSGTTVATLLSSVFALLNFLLLFYYSAQLAVVALVTTVVAVAVVLTTGLLKLRHERQLAELAGHLSGTVLQYLIGIVKLRVAAAENRAFANWAREFTRLRSIAFRAQNIAIIDHTFFSGYSIIINAVIFAVIGMFVLAGGGARMSTGDFVAFSAAFGAFFTALISLSETSIGLLNLVPIYTRVKPILAGIPEVDAAKKHPGELQGSIEVVKVDFSYTADQEILKNTTFSVRPGGFVALVGPSGSGKSTLLRLMLGFEKPSRGSIYYDNQDLADLDVRALRRQLGVVLQGGQLMTGDIFTNIVGTRPLTIDDAWQAARMVGLEEDIDEMPMGMHTVISEGSSTLSGGQRQRILIARAIVHRPRILFFDEATSALDNRTQAIVSRSLEQLKATRIIIAHRLSTVINADRIIVLQNGSIVQTGNYAELVGQAGPFADLAKRQIA
ncbi:MAG: NHLP bacteriocin export ABC transporter permease/ATPase subunit [Betaproteobacteria bacterium]